MKIIILGPSHPYRGGIAAFDERLAEELMKGGNEVELWTFTLQYPSFLFPGKTQYTTDPKPENLSVVRAVNSINPFNWISVGKKVGRLRPDLLIIPFWLPFMSPCLGTISRIAGRNRHTRVISIMHNFIPHEHRIGDRLFCRYFIRSIDGAVALSRSVIDDMGKFSSSLPRPYSPHPLYDSFGEKADREEACRYLGLDPSNRYGLFFGLIRAYKGLDILLDAFADSRFHDGRIKLIIAGEFYGDGEKYHRQAERLGINENIIWHTEFVPDSEVRYFFSAADVVVQPYKSATQSGVTQIAYHFEKPMIVTDVGGLAEIVPDGKVGYVVKPEPEAVADGIVKFFDGDTGRFAEGIKSEKQKYSWRRMIKTIIELKETIEARRVTVSED